MSAPTPEAGLAEQLAAVLDRIDLEEERLRELVKNRKERIAGLRERARELRDVIIGRTGAQLSIPDAAAADVLAAGRPGP